MSMVFLAAVLAPLILTSWLIGRSSVTELTMKFLLHSAPG